MPQSFNFLKWPAKQLQIKDVADEYLLWLGMAVLTFALNLAAVPVFLRTFTHHDSLNA